MKVTLLVTVKHFNIFADSEYDTPKKIFDRDEEFFFVYDMNTKILGIKGSSWKKQVEPDDVADTIKSFFYGQNYVLANIEQYHE